MAAASARERATRPSRTNGAFIAHAREDLPKCLGDIERLRAELAFERTRCQKIAEERYLRAEELCGMCDAGEKTADEKAHYEGFHRAAWLIMCEIMAADNDKRRSAPPDGAE